ncbi:plastocyanin [Corynebacterium diphtheriae]|nr:plastocyanin [Corynebacterium diphtheriae]CAB1021589.1 plastocyanin [Corynebacterium diphtheriae]CAB1046044.1 plastocyanin [Corynebacterium diphtheriae]
MQFPSIEDLRARNTMKWTRYGQDVLPLWVAESDFSTCPAVLQAITDAVQREAFGYPPDGSLLSQATAEFYADRYGYQARPAWIFPIPDVVRGLYIAIDHFTPAQSKVIVPTPAYPPFFHLLSATQREGIFIDATGGIDLHDVEKGFQAGARSILLCNPYNPLGMVFAPKWLNELCDLAHRYDARVLVDEIHAPLVFDGQHTVAAGVSDTAASMCITITAPSKAWNIAGLKCAQIIFSNPSDAEHWQQLSPVIKDGASTLGLIAAEAAYRYGTEFLNQEVAYLKSNHDFLLHEIPKRIPGVKITPMQATYLMWIDFRDTTIEGSPSEFFIEKAKVAMNDGAWFGEEGTGYCRLNFATSREILEEAIDRMAKAVSHHT